MKQGKIKRRLVLLLSLIILPACSPQTVLKDIDSTLGEIFFKQATSTMSQQAPKPTTREFDGELSAQAKEQIDKWLAENGYNRFGDPEGTFYAGGTPLFDEKSGRSLERFEYIFKKIPDILEKIQ